MARAPFEDMSLLTDLYQLTMAQGYFREDHNEPATFSLFIRKYPPHRGYFVSCGLQGIRIDSDDLPALGRQVRRILDDAGLQDVRMVGSGGLDEFDLDELARQGAPYDAYGVGTRMGVSADAPWTDMAYKLVRYGHRPLLKLSTGKASLPDAKQIFRFIAAGRMQRDVIALHDERIDGGEPLLEPVMADGRCLRPHPGLADLRARFLMEYEILNDSCKRIYDPVSYPVEVSARLQALTDELRRRLIAAEIRSA